MNEVYINITLSLTHADMHSHTTPTPPPQAHTLGHMGMHTDICPTRVQRKPEHTKHPHLHTCT